MKRCSISFSGTSNKTGSSTRTSGELGDLILWDNRCTLHARTDFSNRERRMLRRVVVRGERVF